MDWKNIFTSVIITVLGLVVYNMFVSKWLANELETGYLEEDESFNSNGYTKIAA